MAPTHGVSCAREDPCSWVGDDTSLARAEYGHSRHSCSRQRTLDERRFVPCREAAVAYEQDRQRQHLYGRWESYVDAEPVRRGVQTPQAAGQVTRRVADEVGASSTRGPA